jgi:hypothetical protein
VEVLGLHSHLPKEPSAYINVDDESNGTIDDSNSISNVVNSNSIWNDAYISYVSGKYGKKGWKCHWCNKVFYTIHATRVVCHLLKIKGTNIAICKAIIPSEQFACYQVIRSKSLVGIFACAQVKDDIECFIDKSQEEATENLLSVKGHVQITPKKLMSILCLIQKRAEIRRNLHSFNLKLMYP